MLVCVRNSVKLQSLFSSESFEIIRYENQWQASLKSKLKSRQVNDI